MLVLKEVLRQKFVRNILSAESIKIVYILAENKKENNTFIIMLQMYYV